VVVWGPRAGVGIRGRAQRTFGVWGANAEGYVALPNINLMAEMTNMIQATRSYEANVSALQAAKDMALSSLEIGR